jgi:hypothetical protein
MRVKGIQHFFKLVPDLFYMKRFAKLIKQYGITLDSPQHPESCSFFSLNGFGNNLNQNGNMVQTRHEDLCIEH